MSSLSLVDKLIILDEINNRCPLEGLIRELNSEKCNSRISFSKDGIVNAKSAANLSVEAALATIDNQMNFINHQ